MRRDSAVRTDRSDVTCRQRSAKHRGEQQQIRVSGEEASGQAELAGTFYNQAAFEEIAQFDVFVVVVLT